jgi:hypothetical protein
MVDAWRAILEGAAGEAVDQEFAGTGSMTMVLPAAIWSHPRPSSPMKLITATATVAASVPVRVRVLGSA